MDTHKKILRYFEQDSGILALIVIGSRARDTADEYADLDVIVVTASPRDYLDSDDWLENIGPFQISFLEESFLGSKARRTLFDDCMDADLIILNPEQAKGIQEIPGLFARGYRVIKDEAGISAGLREINAEESIIMTEGKFQNLANDFWFHSIWAAKKLLRGDLFTAKYCIDVYMKRLLLTLIEARAQLNGCGDTWYNGRFIEQWADQWVLERLSAAYTTYNVEDIARALLVNMDFFADMAAEIAHKRDCAYPKNAETRAYQTVRKLLLNGNTNGIS